MLKSTDPYFLFLDDERLPSDVFWVRLPIEHPWRVIRTFAAFQDCVRSNGLPLFVSFDHDLADFEKAPDGRSVERTGVDCARWLVQHCLDADLEPPPFSVHSKNPIRAREIALTMSDFKKQQASRGPHV